MAQRYGQGHAHRWEGLLVTVLALALLHYFPRVYDDLWARVQWLNLAMPRLLLAPPARDGVVKALRWTYIAFSFCILLQRVSQESAEQVVQRILEMRRTEMACLPKGYAVSMSFGIVPVAGRDRICMVPSSSTTSGYPRARYSGVTGAALWVLHGHRPAQHEKVNACSLHMGGWCRPCTVCWGEGRASAQTCTWRSQEGGCL